MLKGITIICPETKEEVFVDKSGGYGNSFSFYTVQYFEDWHEDKLRVDKCPSCGKEHVKEI